MIVAAEAFGAFLMALWKKKTSRPQFFEALLGAAKVTGMIFLIIAGAFMFGYFLTITRIPAQVSE